MIAGSKWPVVSLASWFTNDLKLSSQAEKHCNWLKTLLKFQGYFRRSSFALIHVKPQLKEVDQQIKVLEETRHRLWQCELSTNGGKGRNIEAEEASRLLGPAAVRVCVWVYMYIYIYVCVCVTLQVAGIPLNW